MSVYLAKRPDGTLKSPYYQFDFKLTPIGEFKSRRFYGSTGAKKKTTARAVEDELRERAKRGKLSELMTLGQACDRYLKEKAPNVAVHKQPGIPETMEERAKRMARKQQEHCMAELKRFYGADTPILVISPDHVAQAVALRAETPISRERVVDGALRRVDTGKLPAPATVNRQVVQPLRRVLRRAKKHWGVPIDLERFQWGGEDGVMLEEPEDRNRELTPAEEVRFFEALNPEYHGICELYIISGKRQSLWLMLPKTKDRIDLDEGRVRMRKLKKRREEWHWFDLTERELEIVIEAWARDPDSYYLFNAQSQSPRDRGARLPITTRMLYDAVVQACRKAGIKDFHPHDFRHTFGTRAARNTANVKALQVSMDHGALRSTLRYVNVMPDEVKNLRATVRVAKKPPPNVRPFRKTGSE